MRAAVGLVLVGATLGAFHCEDFNCTCQGWANYYNAGASPLSYGCAAGAAVTWFLQQNCVNECNTGATGCQPEPGANHIGCGGLVPWGSTPSATPADFGWTAKQFADANAFINQRVIQRQCLLFAKDGQIVYEWFGNGAVPTTIFAGYSMTKSVGALLVLMAASQGQIDLDAEITKAYGVPSPKEYGVTTRMILTQVLSSDDAPGKKWEYDSLADKWLYLLPRILEATGKSATEMFMELKRVAEFSMDFTWEAVETDWYSGAEGLCSDWARFAQIIASGGMWGDDQILAPEIVHQIAQPSKYPPFNDYSNPCWGHGFWVNADKSKYPGCCWEASRLVAPMCNNESFVEGASTDLVMMLGLWGQVVLAIPSRAAVIVSMGRDFRPLEPVRLGVYPAFCEMLELPCSDEPDVPTPRCGEPIECLGISAQCYAGLPSEHGLNHTHPEPGREECKRCFQQRVMQWNHNPLMQPILKEYCQMGALTSELQVISEYIECFCFDGDDPFVWGTTTTTTPPLGPEPYPVKIYTTTTRPAATDCNVPPSCMDAMHAACGPHNGGDDCYQCLNNWWPYGAQMYGCEIPTFSKTSLIFCMCGTALPKDESHVPVQILNVENNFQHAITFSAVSVGSAQVLCTAEPSSTCELGVAGMGFDLPGTKSLAERAANHLRVSSADGALRLAVFSNWSHRDMQEFQYLPVEPNESICEPWAATAASRIRRFSDKYPIGGFTYVAGCISEDCCAAACCTADPTCDTWVLGPTDICYIGKASYYAAVAGWRGASLDEALCSFEHHWSDKTGYRPVGGVTFHPECADTDCCQQACCDHKSTCDTWGFGTDPTHTYKGCWIGKAPYWQQEYGWLGASGRAVGAPTRSLAHTSSKFDGYYNLIVREDGRLQMDRVEPCQNTTFPVSYAHNRPWAGAVLAAGVESAPACRQHCEDDAVCTTWGYSKNLGCYTGKVATFVYDPSFVTCATEQLAAEFFADENEAQPAEVF